MHTRVEINNKRVEIIHQITSSRRSWLPSTLTLSRLSARGTCTLPHVPVERGRYLNYRCGGKNEYPAARSENEAPKYVVSVVIGEFGKEVLLGGL